jgi:hypothetical protein
MWNSYSESNRKRGRQRKPWRDEVEEDLNTVGLKTGRKMARCSRGWKKIVLESKMEDGLFALDDDDDDDSVVYQPINFVFGPKI